MPSGGYAEITESQKRSLDVRQECMYQLQMPCVRPIQTVRSRKRRTSTFPQTNGSTTPSMMTRPTRWNFTDQSAVPIHNRLRTSGNTGRSHSKGPGIQRTHSLFMKWNPRNVP